VPARVSNFTERKAVLKEGAMKKALLCIVVLVGLLWAGTGYAGMMCWTDGDGNYWKMYVARPDGVSPYKTVTGVWYIPGVKLAPLTGTLQKGLGGTTLRLSVTSTYVRPLEDGLATFFFDAELDPTTKNGTIWYFEDTIAGEYTAAPVTFTKTKCSSLPSPY